MLKIKLIRPTTEKIRLVKLIKECTVLELMKAKELFDSIHKFPEQSHVIPIRDTQVDETGDRINYKSKFIKELNKMDGQYSVIGDHQWERNLKVLKLGLGEQTDYIEFIKNYVFDNFDDSENILKFTLSILSKEQLQQVFNLINIK